MCPHFAFTVPLARRCLVRPRDGFGERNDAREAPRTGGGDVSGDRLTRTELSWLLAQEAKTAAQTLLRGVAPGHGSVRVAPSTEPKIAENDDALRFSGALANLDEAVTALASLQGHASRGRRGRIDLAALVWEVAPEARVQIDVGPGLVVLGEEGELRRMLHVLMAMGGDPSGIGAAQVHVRREGELVRTSVELGPDHTRGFESETKWLAHMTTRYGGSLAHEGNAIALCLPACEDEREVETLRRELAEAQAQGEAYARELAQAMTTVRSETVRSEPPPSLVPSTSPPIDGLTALVSASRALAGDVRGILAAIGRDLTPLRALREGDADSARRSAIDAAASIGRHVAAASELVSDVSRIARCPLSEPASRCNVGELVRDVVIAEAPRAARREVAIELVSPEVNEDDTLPRATVTVLLELLVGFAASISKRGEPVRVRVTASPSTLTIELRIAASELGPRARNAAKQRDLEALAEESGSMFSLIGAFAIAAHLYAPLRVDDTLAGGSRVWLALPRTLPAGTTPHADDAGRG
jgi:two-component system OmpR family sensor kinase